ncbi:unnamed protein product, partial [Brenthis ino]
MFSILLIQLSDNYKDPEPEASETEEQESEEPESEAAKEREARAQASIKEREKQVQRALATSLRDRDKEREYHKRDEAVQHFNALLADLVRNPDLAWREAKKQLKKDHRYSLADELTKDDKERLFGQHISSLAGKRREKLRALLAELGVACTAHWRDVRKLLAEHPAAPVYRAAPQMEREFRDYQRDKQSAAKTALRQLLQETRSLTHRSRAALRADPAAAAALADALAHDARYCPPTPRPARDPPPPAAAAALADALAHDARYCPPTPRPARDPPPPAAAAALADALAHDASSTQVHRAGAHPGGAAADHQRLPGGAGEEGPAAAAHRHRARAPRQAVTVNE